MPATRPRGRETKAAMRARATEIFRRLKRRYPDAHCELVHRNAFELLCATILSAQCTDVRVNMVTPELFRRYPDAESLAVARPEDVEALIRPTGFFRNKTKSLIGMANAVVDRHGGLVPDSMEALRVLPGVGRKTANVILGNAFGINEGVTVDTHVARLSRLLRLSRNTDAERIERDLMGLFPQRDWALLSHLLIFHGRRTCIARRPKCGECVIADLCPSAQV
jgi:endonuclease-3